jgi:GT2 family glycosyltransferase
VKLGICILNWNAGAVLTDCVENLLEASKSFERELVVVDNNSSDASVAQLSARFPEVQVIANHSNLGYARGNNIGARHLLDRGCDLLLFANPDVIVSESALHALLRTLRNTPDAGCCGGLPMNSKGVSRAACRTKPSLFEKLVLYSPLSYIPITRPLRRRHYLNPDSLSDGSPVFAVSGAMVLFRAAAFQQIGGFDEATFLYEEELIAAEGLAAAGWKTLVATSCRYFHWEAHSSRHMPYRRRLHFIRSEQYLLRRYYRLNESWLFLWRVYRHLESVPAYLKAFITRFYSEPRHSWL